MAERRELGFPKATSSLKEQLARTTLQTVRSQGHTYVELREDGKRFIFFCTLCLAPCYSDTVLVEHLNGNLHKERLSCAKLTLLGPNPWPFNDGVLFFDNPRIEKNQSISDSEQKSDLLEHCSENDKLAIVKYDEKVGTGSDGNDRQGITESNEESTHGSDGLVVSGVLIKERTVDLGARFIGFGRVAARLFEKEGSPPQIVKIWCEWLGKEHLSEKEKATVPEHDFAIVTFSYFYNLGRLGMLEDPSCLLTSCQSAESENGEDKGRKRKKSFSDPEDTSDSLCNQYDSSEEVSSANSSRALIAQYDDNLLHQRVIKNKSIRRELRRQQRIFAERICEVCKQKLLPGKDAAAILNLKTGNLACSSRNIHGAFHLFHTSCVIHWFLFCESEIYSSKRGSPRGKKRCRKESSSGKRSEMAKGGGNNGVISEIYSVFCPECQGTGVEVEEGELERDTFPLSQMWRFQIKVGEGRKAWVKNPEKLPNCSTGFCFPHQHSSQEKVTALKRIRFYRVEA